MSESRKPSNPISNIDKVTRSGVLAFLTSDYISLLDSGKFFRLPIRWLYMLLAVVFLISPIFLLIAVIGAFRAGAYSTAILMGLQWILTLVAAVASFLIWWDRKDKAMTTLSDDNEFAVIPVVAHFWQTLGEVIGTAIAITYIWTLISPLVGFLIILFFRFTAEGIRAVAAIVSNTKCISDNILKRT